MPKIYLSEAEQTLLLRALGDHERMTKVSAKASGWSPAELAATLAEVEMLRVKLTPATAAPSRRKVRR